VIIILRRVGEGGKGNKVILARRYGGYTNYENIFHGNNSSYHKVYGSVEVLAIISEYL
jgi:hypothetical protein